jgi:hypothetical protein
VSLQQLVALQDNSRQRKKNMEDDDLAPSQFKVEVDTAEETESVEECRTIIPGRGL